MKALIAVVLACIVSAGVAIALMLRGPDAAWWNVPSALGALVVTVPLLVGNLVPRAWWSD